MGFKKGGFAGLKPVIPLLLMYEWDFFSPAYDVIPFIPQLFLQMSLGYYTVNHKTLPQFIPNDYLFTQHQDKGKDKWEIFAWAIRDIMSKAGPFKKNDQSIRSKLEY